MTAVVEFVKDRYEQMQQGGIRYNEFIESLYRRIRDNRELTPNQIAAVERMIARDEERAVEAANAADVVTGNAVKITGEIVSVKFKDGRFPGFKMLVRDDRGFKVYGNVPAILGVEQAGDCQGERIEFVAEITASDNDPKFGFFKRPKVNTELLFRQRNGLIATPEAAQSDYDPYAEADYPREPDTGDYPEMI